MDLKYLRFIISLALLEDLKSGDLTTNALIPVGAGSWARLVAHEQGIVAGLEIAGEVFKMIDKDIEFKAKIRDGQKVKKGTILAEISGSTRAILAGERTALNFLQRLSGIATQTFKYVEKIKPFRAQIMDTRKTTPALRIFEKYAVKMGGGQNHRFGLFDAVLVKDNHLAAAHGDIFSVISKFGNQKVELEVKNLKEAQAAARAGAAIILLDNLKIPVMQKAVKLIKSINPRIQIEASGGITLSNVKAVAKTGVDRISVGALTHSARALDYSISIASPKL